MTGPDTATMGAPATWSPWFQDAVVAARFGHFYGAAP
jgi:hypothetical protein